MSAKLIFLVAGIMFALLVYGVLQEKIMRVPYGDDKEYFTSSLFLVLCNCITTSAVSAGFLLISKKTLAPAAPMRYYCVISISNLLTTTCQYEALKYVSFPVQTLAKCAKMIPVMVPLEKFYGLFCKSQFMGCNVLRDALDKHLELLVIHVALHRKIPKEGNAGQMFILARKRWYQSPRGRHPSIDFLMRFFLSFVHRTMTTELIEDVASFTQ
ncbi:UDP-galactose/UDP-glucose transporter 5B [Platanthera guangdongensis]|uniref:UDP-galactose/UDP-glucose transporter 5B n=1 Tax=Platanthera guangdongensis TaxID=2320717 RepID=A0ABR2N273_9ASPA